MTARCNLVRTACLSCMIFIFTAAVEAGQGIRYLEARGGIEPVAQAEFGHMEKWKHYSKGVVCGLSAGFYARDDISINVTLDLRLRSYQEHIDRNSWLWTTTVWSGERAVISEIVLGPRLHFRKICEGAYMQFAGGVRLEAIGEVTGDVYSWDQTAYLGEDVRPECSVYRPIGSVLFGYDLEIAEKFYLGLEMNVFLTFDKVEASYSSLAKVGYMISK